MARLGKNLFAGGDLVTGPSTVVQAVTAGREAAGLIESALKIGKPATREHGTERDFSEPSFRGNSQDQHSGGVGRGKG